MRKNKEQQKKVSGKQLSIFDLPESQPDPDPYNGIVEGQETGVELISLSKKQQTLTTILLEEVMDYSNLVKAFKQVLRNKGSSGIDQMDVSNLGEWLVL